MYMQLAKLITLAPIICALILMTSIDAAAQRNRDKKTKIPEEAELTGTYWQLYEMDGKSLPPAEGDARVFIKLHEKKSRLEGFTSCNVIAGAYEYGKEKGDIMFEAVTTKRACIDPTVENYVLEAVNNTNRYEINQHYLLLFNGTYLLAIFEAQYETEED